MSTGRFFYLASSHAKSSTLLLGRSAVTPKFPTTCQQQKLSCQPTPFCTYVTVRVNRSPVIIKGSKLEDILGSVLNHNFRQWKLSRLLHRDTPRQRPWTRPDQLPQKMQTFLSYTGRAMRYGPLPLGVTLSFVGLCAVSMRMYYNWNLVKLPLNDRKAFLMLTDEEALRRYDRHCTLRKSHAVGIDPNDLETAFLKSRVERIMDKLRSANPELNQFLIPGAKWKAIGLRRLDRMGYSPAESVGNGVIFFNPFAVNKLNDDELAHVIAHEMTHVIQKHGIEILSNNIFFCEFFHNILKPMVDFVDVHFDLRDYIRTLAKQFVFPDNTTFEREADDFGIKFASKACYDYRKFADGLIKMLKIADFARNEARQRAGQPEPTGAGEGEGWDEEIMEELRQSDFWFEQKHPTYAERIELLRSADTWRKAEAWRQEKGCAPLPEIFSPPRQPVQATSQTVDEPEKARLQTHPAEINL